MLKHPTGGYGYLESTLSFASAGVVSLPGFAIERLVLPAPIPLAEGFARVAGYLDSVGRPLDALCGLELRIPEMMQWEAFSQLNAAYVAQLADWGLVIDGVPPLTRTNVSPGRAVVAEASLYAASYTVPSERGASGLVISGIPEIPPGASYPSGVLRPGETSGDALAAKVACAVDAVATYIRELGQEWTGRADVHVYSEHDEVPALVLDALALRDVVPVHGLVVHRVATPVPDLELEIDVRQYARATSAE
jgi:hypothetical protein